MDVEKIKNTIRAYENEKEQRLATVKERVTREKIVPFNADIDNSRAKAVSELNAELNTKINAINQECAARISVLRQDYDKRRQELVSLGEQKKSENAEAVIATETAAINVEYDDVLSKLNAILSAMKQ